MDLEDALWEIKVLANAAEYEIADKSDVISKCDDVINEFKEYPYYVMALSLDELKGKRWPEELIGLDNGPRELNYLLKYTIRKHDHDKNDGDFKERMHFIWNHFKYPDVMREFYEFAESQQADLAAAVTKYKLHINGKLA